MRTLQDEYDILDNHLSMEFLKRDNGMIHINLISESAESITYNYASYEIKGEQLLEVGHGEGSYIEQYKCEEQ